MTNSGWIKLHRQFLNWEWSDNPDMVALWVHLLLMSNHDSQKWHGINIERGQCVTGRLKLAKITGLSQRSIRTCLTKLKTTNEIAIKTTNQYSIITICNYDKYQTIPNRSDQQNDQQTGQRPTSDRPATDHKQELKELKNEKNNINISLPVAYLADQEEPSSKTDMDHTPEDPLLEIARAKLVPPNGSHPWESSNPFILTARQPLKRFPEVFLSPNELRHCIELYDGAGIEHLLANALKAVVGRLQQMQMDGKDTARAPCYSWLIGWAYQEQLETHNKTLRIEKIKRPYEQR